MSKVKIQGNASGTGVVTLTAPNTNTDRTITLPDGDISLGVGIDDNATSTAITVSDTGTEIDANLVVTGSSPQIQLETGASKYNWQIAAQENADNSFEISSGNADADATNDTYTPRVVVTSSGNVGIGTSSPSSKLHTKASVDSTDGGLRLESADGNSYATIDINNAGNLRFYQNGTSRMRIDSAGNVGIGTSSPLYTLTVREQDDTVWTMASLSSGYAFGIKTFDGSTVGSIQHNGSSTSFNTSSDYRLKENVVPMTGSIDRLKALKPSRFNFKADADKTVDGFLAHEAGEVVPECATGTKDAMKDEEYEVTPAVMDGDTVVTEAVMGTRSVPDYQGIDQSKLVPLLVASLQEAIARIEQLENA